jgi:hypothetical protein
MVVLEPGKSRCTQGIVSLAKRAGYLDPPAPTRPPERSGKAVFGDMDKFKADFGKPLPDSIEPGPDINATTPTATGD